MQVLSDRGAMTKKLARINSYPLCASCMFTKAHKRLRRRKGKKKRIREDRDDRPGAGTSEDHMISLQPELIPQCASKLMRNRFFGVTIFMDHFKILFTQPYLEEQKNKKHLTLSIAMKK